MSLPRCFVQTNKQYFLGIHHKNNIANEIKIKSIGGSNETFHQSFVKSTGNFCNLLDLGEYVCSMWTICKYGQFQ